MAVPGYNTTMEVETLRRKGLEFEPDLVILGVAGNDLALPNFIQTKRDVLTLRRSFLWDLVREQMSRRPRGGPEAPRSQLLLSAPRDPRMPQSFESEPGRVPSRYRDMVGWEALHNALEDLSSLSRQHRFEVILAPLHYSEVGAEAAALGADLGFHIVDVGAGVHRYMAENGIEKLAGSELAVAPDDAHPSALRNRLAARQIADYMMERGLAGPAP